MATRSSELGRTAAWRAGSLRWSAGVPAAALLLAFGLATSPLLTAGAVVGVALVSVSLAWPLAVVGVMLALGPTDLSILTGGLKSLLPQLGGLDMSGIRLLGVTAGLGLFLLSERSSLREALGPHARWYLLFLAFAAATLAFTPDRLNGVRLLFKLAYPLIFFLVVLTAVRERRDLERLLDWALAGAAAITLLLNPLFVFAGGYTVDAVGNVRVMGLGGAHVNPFSFYVLMVALMALARFSVRGQLRYLIVAAGAAAWVVGSLTRITLLASFAALAGVVLLNAFVTRNYRTVLVALGLGGLIGVGLLPVALERTFGYVPSVGELLSLVQDPVALYYTANLQGREIFWAVIYQAFTTSPFVGVGLGATTSILAANFPESAGLAVHSEYLRALAEVGIVGTLLFAAAVTAWVTGVLRAARTPDPVVREFAVPAVAGILAWVFIAATDNPFDYYAPFTQYIAVLCAGAIAAARIRRAEDSVAEEFDAGER